VRDGGKKNQLEAELKKLSRKLKDLEAEYFERGN